TLVATRHHSAEINGEETPFHLPSNINLHPTSTYTTTTTTTTYLSADPHPTHTHAHADVTTHIHTHPRTHTHAYQPQWYSIGSAKRALPLLAQGNRGIFTSHWGAIPSCLCGLIRQTCIAPSGFQMGLN